MQHLPFLPRLTSGRLILRLARWRIERAEIEMLKSVEDAILLRELTRWRDERRIPRFVRLCESDYYLPIDFENVLSARCFVRSIRHFAFAHLEEQYEEGGLCVHSEEGAFQHEATIPFTALNTAKPSRDAIVATSRYIFPPGSRWVYAKIYASSGQTDQVLSEEVPRLLRSSRMQGLLEKWFFVRFADPDHHLRVRLKAVSGSERELFVAVQERLHEWIPNGLCWRIQFDTYLPEVERYGGPAAMEIAEEIFCHDSDAALEIIRLNKLPRWLSALLGIDSLLSDFQLSVQERLSWSIQLRDGFQQEFKGSIEPSAPGRIYRSHRAEIRNVFGQPNPFTLRSERLKPSVNRLVELGCRNDQLIAHFTHMHVNRVVPLNQRQTECMLYHFLCRWYSERIATSNGVEHEH